MTNGRLNKGSAREYVGNVEGLLEESRIGDLREKLREKMALRKKIPCKFEPIFTTDDLSHPLLPGYLHVFLQVIPRRIRSLYLADSQLLMHLNALEFERLLSKNKRMRFRFLLRALTPWAATMVILSMISMERRYPRDHSAQAIGQHPTREGVWGLVHLMIAQEMIQADKPYKAQHHLKIASDADIPKAMFLLATLYHKGDFLEKNVGKAIELYRKGEEHGHLDSSFVLASLNHTGEAVSRDSLKSVQTFDALSLKMHSKSMSNLAVLHLTGCAQNKEKAFYLLESASLMGEPKAVFNLALMYLKGDGVEQNSEKASQLFTISTELGCEDLLKQGAPENCSQELSYCWIEWWETGAMPKFDFQKLLPFLSIKRLEQSCHEHHEHHHEHHEHDEHHDHHEEECSCHHRDTQAFEVLLQLSDNATCCIKASPQQTIGELRRAVESKSLCSLDNKVLMHAGRLLQDQITVGDYGLKENSVVTVSGTCYGGGKCLCCSSEVMGSHRTCTACAK